MNEMRKTRESQSRPSLSDSFFYPKAQRTPLMWGKSPTPWAWHPNENPNENEKKPGGMQRESRARDRVYLGKKKKRENARDHTEYIHEMHSG
jgi:hypothetical protein